MPAELATCVPPHGHGSPRFHAISSMGSSRGVTGPPAKTVFVRKPGTRPRELRAGVQTTVNRVLDPHTLAPQLCLCGSRVRVPHGAFSDFRIWLKHDLRYPTFRVNLTTAMAHHIRSPTITYCHEMLANGALHFEHKPDELPEKLADGTNLRLWPTSFELSNFLCTHPEYVVGKRVVELGSGSGAVGLVCAALGAASVTLTDVPDALALIARNSELNPPPTGTTVRVSPCLWGDAEHIERLLAESAGGFDVVLCCEVVYQQKAEVLTALAHTQRALARSDGDVPSKVLLAYEFRSGLSEDVVYFDAATQLFGDSTAHTLDSGEAAQFMGGNADDGSEDRLLYIYDVPVANTDTSDGGSVRGDSHHISSNSCGDAAGNEAAAAGA